MEEPETQPIIGSYLLILTHQSLKNIESALQDVINPGEIRRQQFPVIIETRDNSVATFHFIGQIEFNSPQDGHGDYAAILPERFMELPDSAHLADNPAELVEELARHAGFTFNGRGRWTAIVQESDMEADAAA